MLATPLTRTKKSGEPYRRPPDVEAQLGELLRAGVSQQLARAKATDEAASAYVKDECLVYLIREAGLANDSERYNSFVSLLLKRITRGIERKLRALGVADADVEDVHQEVVLAMMSAILEGRCGEFYQVRFRRALLCQILKTHDRYARRHRRAKLEHSLDARVGGGEDGEEDAGTLADLIGSPEEVAADVEKRVIVAGALDAIQDPRHREAFVLHHYYGWPIETNDSGGSLSQRFGVTPRTVSNWLRSAGRELAAWRAAKRV